MFKEWESGINAKFEVFMVVAVKNAVFWDVTLCGSRTDVSEEQLG
jgi:hypothetical protein